MYPVQAKELHQANQHAWASANQSQSPSVAKASPIETRRKPCQFEWQWTRRFQLVKFSEAHAARGDAIE
jgi:hypothetical protein